MLHYSVRMPVRSSSEQSHVAFIPLEMKKDLVVTGRLNHTHQHAGNGGEDSSSA